ncbi:MAG: hypothetical protein AAF611_12925 [Bacteroidota bacterium]
MESQNFTPQESLQLISQVIEDAKTRFEENGFIYVFWGFLIAAVAFAQFILLQNEYYAINWYPYFLVPFGVAFSMFYYMRKKKKTNTRNNQISTIISKIWIALAINKMILGFVFAPMLAENLSPIILILLAIGILVSAVALKSNALFISSIFINIAGIVCFKVDWGYQSLILGTVSLVAVAIPGLIMMRNYKRRNTVAAV